MELSSSDVTHFMNMQPRKRRRETVPPQAWGSHGTDLIVSLLLVLYLITMQWPALLAPNSSVCLLQRCTVNGPVAVCCCQTKVESLLVIVWLGVTLPNFLIAIHWQMGKKIAAHHFLPNGYTGRCSQNHKGHN